MLKVLLKKQLAEIFRVYFYNPKSNKRRSVGSTVGFFVFYAFLMLVICGGMFGFLAYSLCRPLVAAGLDWLYFTLLSLIAVALGTFGSVFNTYSGLYLAKDNDLLLSMPIPVRYIMLVRLLGVYLMGLLYSGIVLLPAAVIYLIFAPVTALTVVGVLLLILLISVVVLLLSCLLGWVVAKISLKLKNKSFITVLASLIFLAAYYFVYFKAQDAIMALVSNAEAWGEKFRSAAYPLYLLGKVGTGDPLAMGIWTAAVAALTALLWWLMARSFLRIATSTGNTAKAVYREKAATVRSAFSALLGKEFARFTKSPAYMLNCGLGLLFLAAAAALSLWRGFTRKGRRIVFLSIAGAAVLSALTLFATWSAAAPKTAYEAPETEPKAIFSEKRVLAVVPHEDDDLNLLSGVTGQFTDAGSEVYVVFVSTGDAAGLGRSAYTRRSTRSRSTAYRRRISSSSATATASRTTGYTFIMQRQTP